jgi:hypothetical protein
MVMKYKPRKTRANSDHHRHFVFFFGIAQTPLVYFVLLALFTFFAGLRSDIHLHADGKWFPAKGIALGWANIGPLSAPPPCCCTVVSSRTVVIKAPSCSWPHHRGIRIIT